MTTSWLPVWVEPDGAELGAAGCSRAVCEVWMVRAPLCAYMSACFLSFFLFFHLIWELTPMLTVESNRAGAGEDMRSDKEEGKAGEFMFERKANLAEETGCCCVCVCVGFICLRCLSVHYVTGIWKIIQLRNSMWVRICD